MALLLKLSIILFILENNSLIQHGEKLPEEELPHVRCHERPLQSYLLDMLLDIKVAMRSDAGVNY